MDTVDELRLINALQRDQLEKQETAIKALSDRVCELYDEVRFWQQQALKDIRRD